MGQINDEMMPLLDVKDRYNFNDIYIFGKTADGYISLSDYELSYNYCVDFQSESRFLIGLPSVNEYYLAEITLDEILAIAGIASTTNFICQCRNGVDELTSDELIAILCAKKILNTKHGKIELVDGNDIVYRISRRKTNGEKRVYSVVCEKRFTKGVINGKV